MSQPTTATAPHGQTPSPENGLPDATTFRTEAFTDMESGLRAVRRLIRLCYDERRQFVAAMGATVLATLAQLTIPLLLGYAVEKAQMALTDGGGAHELTWIAVALLVMSIARGALTMAQNYFAESVGHHLAHRLRGQIYAQIQRLSYDFHDRVHSGDLITVGMLDLEGVRMFFSTGLVRTVNLVLLIGIGAGLMIHADPVLGIVSLAFVPIAAWSSSIAHLKLRATWHDLQRQMSLISRVMEENLGGIRVARAFASQDYEMKKFDDASAPALKLSHKRIAIRVANTSFMTLFFFGAMGLALWVGGARVISGHVSIGTLTSVLTFLMILQMPIRQLGMVVNAFARAGTTGSRVFALIDAAPTIHEKPKAPALHLTETRLRFEYVRFRYGPDQPMALDGISFEARKGETLGLVGAPGSGKSTIANMIPRFYDPQSGRITLDGQDLRDVSLASLRHAVVPVQQDTFLFTTSLENNIVYGSPRADDFSLRRAAESAQLHDYVMGLPAGYRTLIGERGGSLSGGQRQRLSIARALLLHPDVLILDDSTAAIDAGTEQRLRRALRQGEQDRLTLIIAHRLGSLAHADRIIYLDKGRIVEEGTHDQLIARGGLYAQLHDLQMRPTEDAR